MKTTYDKNRKLWQPEISEEHVINEILSRLTWAKIKIYRIRERIPGKWKLSTPGIPDLIGWVPQKWGEHGWEKTAIPLFIECKSRTGVHRVAQTRFIEEAKADGCVAFFASSWEDVVRNFKEAGLEWHS